MLGIWYLVLGIGYWVLGIHFFCAFLMELMYAFNFFGSTSIIGFISVYSVVITPAIKYLNIVIPDQVRHDGVRLSNCQVNIT